MAMASGFTMVPYVCNNSYPKKKGGKK